MTAKEANAISIKEYLNELGFRSVKEKTYYGMYLSPFRQEMVPSFKVDYRLNLWFDFGVGEGGTMIDLFMKINQCTFHEAMLKMQARSTDFSFSFHGKIPQVTLKKTLPLTNFGLIKYIKERSINMDTALLNCVEVHYSVNGKNYYAVGFKNDSNGYELRNPWFKGSLSPKDLTTVYRDTDECIVFKGFMDYLSYLTINSLSKPFVNAVILNSVSHLDRAILFLKSHKIIYAYLDSDRAGISALEKIRLYCKRVFDESLVYKGYKDLNQYLVKTQLPPNDVL